MNSYDLNQTHTFRMLLLKGTIFEGENRDFITPSLVKEKWKKNQNIENILIFKNIFIENEIIIILFFEKYYSKRNLTLMEELKNYEPIFKVKWSQTIVLNKNKVITELQRLCTNEYSKETLDHPK